jgi:hypothetical protein
MGKQARRKQERRHMAKSRAKWQATFQGQRVEVERLSQDGDVLVRFPAGPDGRSSIVMMSSGYADRLLRDEGE